jgi:hypothetical protein
VEPQKKSHHKIAFYRRLHVIAYRATLDVPGELVQFVAELLWTERRRRGGRAGACGIRLMNRNQ